MTHLAYVRVSSYLSTAPRSASLSLASPWSSPAPEQGMMSASVYWALPYSNVSSPSTSRSASLSAALSFILHVAKPVPVKQKMYLVLETSVVDRLLLCQIRVLIKNLLE